MKERIRLNKKNISILHILTSHAWGGLELYVVSLVKKSIEEGLSASVYCIQNSKVHKECEKLGIHVFFAHKQSRFSLKDISRLKKILNEGNFSVLHTHTSVDVWLGSFVKRICPIRFIHSVYMSAPKKKGFVYGFIYSQVDSVTSSSELLNQQLLSNYPIAKEKVHLLRYGRELNCFPKNTAEALFVRSLWNTKSTEIVFATFCRIDAAKGVREFAQSLEYLEEKVKAKIKLWIMGEPTLLYTNENGEPVYEEQSKKMDEWLKSYAETQPGKVEFIPFQKNLRPYLESIDVFVLGTYKETYSLSVLDAMGFGVPVIGTASGGTIEQVKQGERGLLVEPRSSQSIADAIGYYVHHPEHISLHGLQAKQWVEKEHNWHSTLDQFIELYQKD
jgi:D-inositol-3-phosphate glycosyltransferase